MITIGEGDDRFWIIPAGGAASDRVVLFTGEARQNGHAVQAGAR